MTEKHHKIKFWQRAPIIDCPIDLTNPKLKRQPLVFVIGAGASKDAGMPICSDFVSSEYMNRHLCYLSEEARFAYEQLTSGDEPLEVALAKAMNCKNDELVRAILYLYEEVFVSAETLSGGYDRWAYLPRMVIRSIFNTQNLHPVYITFNHDLYLEEASSQELHYNYGTLTNKLFCRENLYPGLAKFGYDYTILKMYGSFNMLSCNHCARIMSWSDYTWQFSDCVCDACGIGKISPLYIPPTPNKDYNPLADCWRDAIDALQRAYVVIVIGYSLPKYDHEARVLFTHINPYASIWIADKYAAFVAPRYKNFPGRTKAFLSISASEFCELVAVGKDVTTRFMYM